MKKEHFLVSILCAALVLADTKPAEFGPKTDSSIESLIVGGRNAEEGEIPYQVSLRLPAANLHFCGGAIISDRFILTAAHCMAGLETKPHFVVAVMGSANFNQGIRVKIEKIMSHKDWDRVKLVNDISLLRTAEKIKFSKAIQPINLPLENLPKEGNTQSVLSGWGKSSLKVPTHKDILQLTEPRTISLEECTKRFESLHYSHLIHPKIVCTINDAAAGACNGDSGGPLVDVSNSEDKYLVGIVSWGIPCGLGYPDVFTRVYSYLDWIHDNMGE